MLVEEISRSFDKTSLALPAVIKSILLKAMNNAKYTPMKVADIFSETYSKDINMKKLHNQLQMTPDLATMYKTSQNLILPLLLFVRSCSQF